MNRNVSSGLLRQAMRVNEWGVADREASDVLSVEELAHLRRGCDVMGSRLKLGALTLVASSDPSASLFVVERNREFFVLSGPADTEKLGDRLRSVDAWLDAEGAR